MSISSLLARLDRAWRSDDRLRGAVIGVLLVGGLLPPLLVDTFYLQLLNRILILALIATAFNFAFGFGNVPSFGHAAFYATGGYGVVMLTTHSDRLPLVGDGILLPVLLAVIASFALAVFIGYFSLRGVGLYFALISFGLAEVYHQLILRAEITNGIDGMIFVRPELPLGLTPDATVLYYLSIALLVTTVGVLRWLLQSPFGRVMRAIRANDERARYIGYPVDRVKLLIFVISAIFTTFGGVLVALQNLYVNPDLASAATSIDLILVTVIGGVSYLLGPVVGAAFLVLIEHVTRDIANLSLLVIGFTFIVVILYAPEGLYGKARDLWPSDGEK